MLMRCLLPAAAVVAALAAAPSDARAQPEGVEKGPIGLGIIIGEPTGVCAKLYLDDDTAVDAAVGSAVVSGGLQVHGDYLWHPWILTDEETFVLPAYLGPGLRLLLNDRGRGADDDFHIGIRGVAGMLFDFKTIPLDVFLEVAGVVDWVFSDDDMAAGLGISINGGAGVRYYF